MEYFDYKKVAREAGIADGKLSELCRVMRSEFPRDDMMFELHVLRACMAVRDGHIRIEDALGTEAATRGARGGRSLPRLTPPHSTAGSHYPAVC